MQENEKLEKEVMQEEQTETAQTAQEAAETESTQEQVAAEETAQADPDAESAGEFAGMESLEQRAFTDEGTIDLFQWFDKDMGLMYSLSTSGADLDGFDITAIAGAIYAQAEEAE